MLATKIDGTVLTFASIYRALPEAMHASIAQLLTYAYAKSSSSAAKVVGCLLTK